jgi:hypothetical protein
MTARALCLAFRFGLALEAAVNAFRNQWSQT